MANVVKVVCSDAEKAAWGEAAGFESLSGWCRRVLNAALAERGVGAEPTQARQAPTEARVAPAAPRSVSAEGFTRSPSTGRRNSSCPHGRMVGVRCQTCDGPV